MSESDRPSPERFSLKRWSARKLDAARTTTSPAPSTAPASEAPVAPAPTVLAQPAPPPAETPELPPVESLTFDSDFKAFLDPEVAEPLKRQALKKLFSDPRFNVMDGLDVYIDDYSTPSPIEPELVAQLLHARFTLDPPATRVNAQGHVEDVPPGEIDQAETLHATPAPDAVTDASTTSHDVQSPAAAPVPPSHVPGSPSK